MCKTVINIFLIFCALSYSLSAQKTFVWQGHYDFQPGYRIGYKYYMYNLDIRTGATQLLFTIDSSRLRETYTTGRSSLVSSFTHSADFEKIYFLEEEGVLYCYHVDQDSMEYIQDITPLNTDNLYHTINRFDHIELIHPDTLYCGGPSTGLYCISSKTFTYTHQSVPFPLMLSPTERSRWGGFCLTKHKDRYLGHDGNSLLVEIDRYNPNNHKVVMSYGSPNKYRIDYVSLISKQHSCDSTSLYIIGRFGDNFRPANNPGITIDKIYPYEQRVIQNYRNYPTPSFIDTTQPFTLIFDSKHYNNPTWEDCQVRVDLDVDDSTTGGRDFLVKDLCRHTNIPLSDIDIEVSNEEPLDSILIQVDNPLFSHALQIPVGNYNLAPGLNFWNKIYNNGTTTNKEFTEAIRNAVFINNGPRDSREIVISITPYYNGVAGKIARAFIKITDPLPDSGEDRLISGCVSDSLLYLKSLNPPIDVTDMYIWRNTNIDLFSFKEPFNDTFLFVTRNGMCFDTAKYTFIVYENPGTANIADTILCNGQVLSINIDTIADMITWNDGLAIKQKTITTDGNYHYSVRDINGCTSMDSFSISYLPPPISQTIDTTLCVNNTLTIDNIEYDKAGTYLINHKYSIGCDSVIKSITLGYFPSVPLVVQGDLGICLTENTALTIDQKYTDIKLNDVSTKNEFEISKAGEYKLTAFNAFGCKEEIKFTVLEYPQPIVDAIDMNDTVYIQDLKIASDYSPDVSSYKWSPSKDLSCSDCPYPSLLSPADGLYNIEVTNSYGCASSDQLSITFKKAIISLPNVVANRPAYPDNGLFYAKSNTSMTYSMVIYDRWGSIVYAQQDLISNDPSRAWKPEGKYTQGVYVYMITYTDKSVLKRMTGTITLL